MKISTKGRYALRLMMELAQNYGQGLQSVDEIAKNQRISGKYIHVLVLKLKSAGLVRAVRGPNGGYELAKKPSSITAGDVVWAMEGRSALVPCVAKKSSCSKSCDCVARDLWCEVSSTIDKVLSRYTLARLVTLDRAKRKRPAKSAGQSKKAR